MSPYPASARDDLVASQATAFTASISGQDGFPARTRQDALGDPFLA